MWAHLSTSHKFYQDKQKTVNPDLEGQCSLCNMQMDRGSIHRHLTRHFYYYIFPMEGCHKTCTRSSELGPLQNSWVWNVRSWGLHSMQVGSTFLPFFIVSFCIPAQLNISHLIWLLISYLLLWHPYKCQKEMTNVSVNHLGWGQNQ